MGFGMAKSVKNEWITIKGHTMLCKQLMLSLYYGDFRLKLKQKGQNILNRYCVGSNKMQELLDEYMYGETVIRYGDDYFYQDGLEVPESKKLPDAIEELFCNLENEINVDLNRILIEAESKSNTEIQARMEAEKRDSYLCGVASDLMKGEKLPESNIEKIMYILKLQEKKRINSEYNVSNEEREKEKVAAELWCNLLTRSIINDKLSYYLMKSLVQQGFVKESDFSEILEDLGDKRDFEWYDEDFLGCELMEETIIPLTNVLKMVETELKKLLHIV